MLFMFKSSLFKLGIRCYGAILIKIIPRQCKFRYDRYVADLLILVIHSWKNSLNFRTNHKSLFLTFLVFTNSLVSAFPPNYALSNCSTNDFRWTRLDISTYFLQLLILSIATQILVLFMLSFISQRHYQIFY